mmetsp:Transcript_7250/g.15846  ORF Transcript_7250/g.15846 Transcript_7250/m.15846 type:complete len:232 (-) Transcript_7250:180-875(-)
MTLFTPTHCSDASYLRSPVHQRVHSGQQQLQPRFALHVLHVRGNPVHVVAAAARAGGAPARRALCGAGVTQRQLQVLLHVRQLHRVGRQLLQTPQARRGLVSIATPTLALPPLQQPVLQPEHDLIAGQGEAQARLEQPEVDALQCQYPRRRHLVDGSDFQPQCWEVNTLEYLQHARTIQKLPVGWVCVDVVAVDRARSGLEVPRVEYQERQQVQRVRLLRVRLLLVTEVLL